MGVKYVHHYRETSLDISKSHEVERWTQERTSRHGLKGEAWFTTPENYWPFAYYWSRVDRLHLVCCLWFIPGKVFLREVVITCQYRGNLEDKVMAKSKLDEVLSKIEGNGVIGEKAHDEVFAAEYPNVHMLFTETEKAKGKGRQTCTIVMYASAGLFNVIITERDLGVKLFASGASVDEMWACLEERVSSPSPDWVKDTKKKH